MQPFRFILVAVLILASTTCQPPMQRSPTQSAAQVIAATLPARPEARARPMRPAQAPAMVGAAMGLGKKTFPQLAEGELLFSVRVPRAGWWMFCLAGTKPEDVRMSFHAVLPLGNDNFWQVDHFAVIREGGTTVDACVQMEQTEDKLPVNQEVQIRSRFDIPGPITVTATYRQVDYPEARR